MNRPEKSGAALSAPALRVSVNKQSATIPVATAAEPVRKIISIPNVTEVAVPFSGFGKSRKPGQNAAEVSDPIFLECFYTRLHAQVDA
jgi:hypothetical protein